MIDVIYYAHSMTIYNTEREQQELLALDMAFPNGCVYNPNRPYIETHRAPMSACFEVVKSYQVTGLAFSTAKEDFLSMGVYAELRAAQKRPIPAYRIFPDGTVKVYHQKPRLVKLNKTEQWAKV